MFLPSDGIRFAFPAIGTLAAGMGLSKPTVRAGLRELEEAGYLTVSWSRGGSSHRYWMRLPGSRVPDELCAEYEAATRKNRNGTRKNARETHNALSGNRATAKQGARSAESERAQYQECETGGGDQPDELASDEKNIAESRRILDLLHASESSFETHGAGPCDDCGAACMVRVAHGRAVLCSRCQHLRIRAAQTCAE